MVATGYNIDWPENRKVMSPAKKRIRFTEHGPIVI
jgi:hypothetical protein